MQTKTKAIIVALAFTIIGFMLNPMAPIGSAIWGEAVISGDGPTGTETAFLTAYAVLESILFGVGVAFLAFAWPLVKKVGGNVKAAGAAFVAIAWLLVSWVPHSAMHMTNAHDNYARLVVIEYVFHVTLGIAGIVLLVFFIGVLKKASTPPTVTPAPEEGATA
jgi:hypothetical protein